LASGVLVAILITMMLVRGLAISKSLFIVVVRGLIGALVVRNSVLSWFWVKSSPHERLSQHRTGTGF
jgi:hypothetical protein